MKKNILYLLFCVLLVSCAVGDYHDAPTVELDTPYGTWKLESMDGKNFLSEKVNRKDAYTLKFKSNNVFTGVTSSNEISGTYSVEMRGEKRFSFDFDFTPLSVESKSGNEFVDCLKKVYDYKVSQTELQLIYSETKYLQFSLISRP